MTANQLANLFGAFLCLFCGVPSAIADVKIGVAGPMSGQYAWFGEQMLQGAELAVADLKAKGGLQDQNIELIIGDDACNPAQAEAVANKFLSDGVVFVAGHWCSSSSIPAAKIYEKAGVLMITPASTNPKLTDEGGRNVFRQTGRDDQQGIVAGTYLAEKWEGKKIAFLHDGTAYGKDLVDATKAQMNKLGVSEVMYEAIQPGQTGYTSIIADMQKTGIDVFYLGGYSTEAALLIRDARDMNYDVQMISGDALSSEEFGITAGDAAEGTLITFFPDAREYPEAKEVVTRFRNNGFEPEGYTLMTYAVIQTWAQALSSAGSVKLDDMIDALHREEFRTVIGTYKFNKNGDMTAPGFVWYTFKDGSFKIVK